MGRTINTTWHTIYQSNDKDLFRDYIIVHESHDDTVLSHCVVAHTCHILVTIDFALWSCWSRFRPQLILKCSGVGKYPTFRCFLFLFLFFCVFFSISPEHNWLWRYIFFNRLTCNASSFGEKKSILHKLACLGQTAKFVLPLKSPRVKFSQFYFIYLFLLIIC